MLLRAALLLAGHNENNRDQLLTRTQGDRT